MVKSKKEAGQGATVHSDKYLLSRGKGGAGTEGGGGKGVERQEREECHRKGRKGGMQKQGKGQGDEEEP